MKQLNDLELPEIDMFDEAYWRDPHSVYQKAREKSWLAKYQFGYFVLDHESMVYFMRNDKECRTPNRDVVQMWNAQGTAFDRFGSHSLVAISGDKHKRLRGLVAPAFTPKAADKHRQFMRDTLNHILDNVDAGSCDFNEIAAAYPITAMCRLIGVPFEDVEKFAHWLEPQEGAVGQDDSVLPEIEHGLVNMFEYVSGLIEERLKPGDHPDDLLQDLVNLANQEGEALNEEELRVMLILLLGAGYDTTKNQLNLIIKMFSENAAEHQKLLDDPKYIKPLINESLRYKNPIGATHRVTNVDIEHRGVLFPANTFVTIPVTFAGWDKEYVANPEVFDACRKDAPPTTAFGQGIHICLGQFLARALLEEGLPILARRMNNNEPAGDIVYRSPLGIWGYKSIPIKFDLTA